ncbi:MAG: murein biosynthesis integral membrane protein MurJ [Nitrospirota bacterium]
MSEQAKVTKAAGTIVVLTFISRVLGFVRDMVVAKMFGAYVIADAFLVAFRICNLLREMFAEGSMSAAFIPVLTEYLELRSKEEARELASSLFNILLFILSGVVILGIALSPTIVTLMAPGFIKDPEKFRMTVYLTRIMFPYILFIGLAAVGMGVLNSIGSFSAPALSSSMLNISMIGFALGLSPKMANPIVGQAFGVIFGGMLQLLILLPPMKKKGFGLMFVFKPAHEGVKKVAKLALPVVGSQAVVQINVFVSSIIASYLAVGSISYLYYATRLYQFPHGIFGIAIATAILPSMSRQAAARDYESLKDTLSFGIRYIFFINLPAMVGLIVLRVPITSLLFQRGAFDYTATLGTAYALLFYSLGLWAYSGVRIVNSAFYSLQDTRTPVIGALVSVFLNICFSLILMRPLKHGGLALATAAAASINMGLLVYMFRRRMGLIGGRRILKSFIKTAAASTALGFACYYLSISDIWKLSGHSPQKTVIVLYSMLAGTAAYFLVQYILKSEELGFIFNTFKFKFHRDKQESTP